MDFIDFFKTTFSTREQALLIWLFIAIAAMMFSKSIRSSLWNLAKALFCFQISTILLCLTAYIIFILVVLQKVEMWNMNHAKDTIFWFSTSALVLFFSINKAKGSHFFTDVIKENLKWTIVLEFMVNFYTFSLLKELLFVPTVFWLSLTLAYAKTYKKDEQVIRLLEKAFQYLGVFILFFIVYKTVADFKVFLSLQTLFSFLFPPIMTILLIPFLYLLALYMNYESLFIRLDFFTNDNRKVWLIKKEILLTANFNLNRLERISNGLSKFDWYHSKDIKEYVTALALGLPVQSKGGS